MSTPGVDNFSTTLDDADSLIRYNNNVSSTLTAGINNSVLLVPVASPSSFSSSSVVTITDSLTSPTKTEIVIYTSKSGSDLVVPPGGRGAQGTTSQSFLGGRFVEQRATARGFTVFADAIIAVEQKIGTGDFPDIRWNDTTVANTTTETSLLAAVDAGSKTLKARVGAQHSYFRITAYGRVTTTGTPNLRIRLKLGSNTIADTGASIVLASNTDSGPGGFVLEAIVVVEAGGSSGTVLASLTYRYTGANGGAMNQVAHAINTTPINLNRGSGLGFDGAVECGEREQ